MQVRIGYYIKKNTEVIAADKHPLRSHYNLDLILPEISKEGHFSFVSVPGSKSEVETFFLTDLLSWSYQKIQAGRDRIPSQSPIKSFICIYKILSEYQEPAKVLRLDQYITDPDVLKGIPIEKDTKVKITEPLANRCKILCIIGNTTGKQNKFFLFNNRSWDEQSEEVRSLCKLYFAMLIKQSSQYRNNYFIPLGYAPIVEKNKELSIDRAVLRRAFMQLQQTKGRDHHPELKHDHRRHAMTMLALRQPVVEVDPMRDNGAWMNIWADHNVVPAVSVVNGEEFNRPGVFFDRPSRRFNPEEGFSGVNDMAIQREGIVEVSQAVMDLEHTVEAQAMIRHTRSLSLFSQSRQPPVQRETLQQENRTEFNSKAIMFTWIGALGSCATLMAGQALKKNDLANLLIAGALLVLCVTLFNRLCSEAPQQQSTLRLQPR